MKQETQEVQELKRFDVKTEVKVIKALSNLLSACSSPISEDVAVKSEHCAVMDGANVCMVIGVTEEAKRCLSRFKDVDSQEQRIPTLNYSVLGESKISNEYMLKALKVIDASANDFHRFNDEGVVIHVAKEYPITLENHHFKIVIAPRVED